MRHLIASLCLALLSLAAMADGAMEKSQVKGSFDETKEALVTAIENRGLVINYTSHIADMLARTGADLGATKKIYEKAEIIEFCSAGLSRKMMETDPHNIVFCPFAISVYTLPGQNGTTWLAYRKPTGSAAGIAGPLLLELLREVSQ